MDFTFPYDAFCVNFAFICYDFFFLFYWTRSNIAALYRWHFVVFLCDTRLLYTVKINKIIVVFAFIRFTYFLSFLELITDTAQLSSSLIASLCLFTHYFLVLLYSCFGMASLLFMFKLSDHPSLYSYTKIVVYCSIVLIDVTRALIHSTNVYHIYLLFFLPHSRLWFKITWLFHSVLDRLVLVFIARGFAIAIKQNVVRND